MLFWWREVSLWVIEIWNLFWQIWPQITKISSQNTFFGLFPNINSAKFFQITDSQKITVSHIWSTKVCKTGHFCENKLCKFLHFLRARPRAKINAIKIIFSQKFLSFEWHSYPQNLFFYLLGVLQFSRLSVCLSIHLSVSVLKNFSDRNSIFRDCSSCENNVIIRFWNFNLDYFCLYGSRFRSRYGFLGFSQELLFW